MNKTWYECKVKYRKTTDTGNQKVVTEPYLVDAISFTEADSIINERMREYISEEFKVVNIKPVNYSEIVDCENADTWFKSKVSLLAYDEETGKERKQNIYLLVQANTVEGAFANTIYAMQNTMGEYSIPSISETKIVEVFHFVSQEAE